ncbi:MAG TPA: hypothetical protein H9896_02350 [Candidatus Pygmaiobacter gallistercoris]|nr:hypothetical protein [Candidatus Pygmaiobacter gallistercoris]
MREKCKALLRYPLVLVFFVFLVVYSIADSTVNDRKESELENRTLAQKPTLTLSNLLASEENKKFSYLYEQYINDQFLGRDGWISLKSRAESLLLKVENNGVVYGDEGTMYQKFFTLQSAATGGLQVEANIDAVSTFAARHPGLATVMVVPSADMILTDLLPAGAPFVDESPWMEQIAASLGGNAAFLDLTDTLRAHSDEYLFYRTDHHWTTLGAYYAYLDYAASAGKEPISLDFLTATTDDAFFGTLYSKSKKYNAVADQLSYYPQLDGEMTILQLVDPETRKQVEEAYASGSMSEEEYAKLADRTVDLYDTDKLTVRDKYAMFLYGNNGFARIRGSGEGKLMVIKDSYANCFIPFLLENYAEIDVVDLRYLRDATIDELIDRQGYDDLLILYNFQSFSSDTNLVLLNSGV